MSFYHLPNPWDPGYAIPEYVMAEPPGRGTFTTKWMPRGTIPTLVPDFLAKPGQKLLGRDDADLAGLGSLGESSLAGPTLRGSTLARHSLRGDSLGARVYTLEPLGATGGDPIGAYGQKAAAYILSTVGRVPASQRKAALRALLDAVDPGLWAVVDARAAEAAARGLDAKAALAQGLARSFSEGMAKELIAIGRGQKIESASQVGLGVIPARRAHAANEVMEALGWNPISAIADTAAKAAGSVGKAGGWVAGQIREGGETAGGWVKAGVGKLGDLACALVNSNAGQVGAGAAGLVAGGPGGAAAASAGAQVAAQTCAKGGGAAMPPVAAESSTPSWVLPAAIGGGALILIAALR